MGVVWIMVMRCKCICSATGLWHKAKEHGSSFVITMPYSLIPIGGEKYCFTHLSKIIGNPLSSAYAKTSKDHFCSTCTAPRDAK